MCFPSVVILTLALDPSVVVQPLPSSSQLTLAIPDKYAGSLPFTVTVCGPLTHAGAADGPLNDTLGV